MSKKKIIAVVWSTAGAYTLGFVAIKSHNGWKAYMHLAPGVTEEYDAHHVANYGAKMNKEQAIGFFPQFNAKEYES